MNDMDLVPTPFGEPVEELFLSDPPLIVALAQIRFPAVASIAREEFIGPFQERIRDTYPFLREERAMLSVQLDEGGVQAQLGDSPVWQFCDDAQGSVWKVSLATSFVALETVDYPSHAEFLGRLREVLVALKETVRPASCTRIGLRYVDRVAADPDLPELIRDEMIGIVSADSGTEARMQHALTDVQFNCSSSILHGRWGLLPSNAILDNLYGRPVPMSSWILDLDMYTDDVEGAFDVTILLEKSKRFAEDIYRFFRWAVRPELLRRCGGKI